MPLVAVGLLYRYGYFRQRLRNDGWQEEHYGETFPNDLAITLIKNPDGTPLRIQVSIRERNVLAQVWRADVGRILREVEDWWIDHDFIDDKLSAIEKLKAVVQGMAY